MCTYVLVNNAADGSSEPLLEATPEHLEKSFGVNVYGPIYLTQAVVNTGKMPRGGRIINIGSVVSKMGMALAAVYAAAKAAQDSLTASWASEVCEQHYPPSVPFALPHVHTFSDFGLTTMMIELNSLVSNTASPSTHLHWDLSQQIHRNNTS